MPSGRGLELSSDLEDLIADCRQEIPRVFEDDKYQQRRAALAQRLHNQREQVFAEMRALAETLGFTIEFSQMGVMTVPLLEHGDYAFERPSKITARLGMGEDGVVGIEREVKLSGRRTARVFSLSLGTC